MQHFRRNNLSGYGNERKCSQGEVDQRRRNKPLRPHMDFVTHQKANSLFARDFRC